MARKSRRTADRAGGTQNERIDLELQERDFVDHEELRRLRGRLLKLAGASLRSTNPRAVGAAEDAMTRGDSPALEAALASISDARFRDWKPVLVALMDVELAAVRLGVAIRLLREPEAGVPAAVGLSAGWWADAHRELAVFELDAMLDRMKTLASRIHRHLIRPYTASPTEQWLAGPVHQFSDQWAGVRNAQAHGGAPVDRLITSTALEFNALVGDSPDPEELVEQQGLADAGWRVALESTAGKGVAFVNAMARRMEENIPWSDIDRAIQEGAEPNQRPAARSSRTDPRTD